jgi:hypothetical protein
VRWRGVWLKSGELHIREPLGRSTLSFAKTPQCLSVFHATYYTASLHVIHCKGALNFGEGQPRARPQSVAGTLERRRVVYDLEESQRQCGQCQTPMNKIGEDVSERLEFIPASLRVIEEVRSKYACAKGCGVAAAQKPGAH